MNVANCGFGWNNVRVNGCEVDSQQMSANVHKRCRLAAGRLNTRTPEPILEGLKNVTVGLDEVVTDPFGRLGRGDESKLMPIINTKPTDFRCIVLPGSDGRKPVN